MKLGLRRILIIWRERVMVQAANWEGIGPVFPSRSDNLPMRLQPPQLIKIDRRVQIPRPVKYERSALILEQLDGIAGTCLPLHPNGVFRNNGGIQVRPPPRHRFQTLNLVVRKFCATVKRLAAGMDCQNVTHNTAERGDAHESSLYLLRQFVEHFCKPGFHIVLFGRIETRHTAARYFSHPLRQNIQSGTTTDNAISNKARG